MIQFIDGPRAKEILQVNTFIDDDGLYLGTSSKKMFLFSLGEVIPVKFALKRETLAGYNVEQTSQMINGF